MPFGNVISPPSRWRRCGASFSVWTGDIDGLQREICRLLTGAKQKQALKLTHEIPLYETFNLAGLPDPHKETLHRVSVHCGDLFAPLAGDGLEQAVDIVVCNPPYIPSGSLSKLAAEIVEHEPLVALAYLRPGGLLSNLAQGRKCWCRGCCKKAVVTCKCSLS